MSYLCGNKSFVMEKTISERKLDLIIRETVSDVIKRLGLISEMAVTLKDYRKRIDGLRFQLAENWCLCRWCQVFSPQNPNFRHWTTELKACINALKFVEVKNRIGKEKTLTRMLIVDYDYDSPYMVANIIRDKFKSEGVTDEGQIETVANGFAEGIRGLIRIIAATESSTDEYIRSTFQG